MPASPRKPNACRSRASDTAGLIAFCKRAAIDFVVVGPEAPLVAGLVDALEGEGIAAFGPTAAAAALEGSKAFMKDLCAREGIPTAAYRRFRDAAAAKAYIAEQGAPIVVKADGLAAGKGVVVAATIGRGLCRGRCCARRRTVRRGRRRDRRRGIPRRRGGELLRAVRRHHMSLPLAAAQDHKRVGDGDTGPNTGGMGAYSPAPS